MPWGWERSKPAKRMSTLRSYKMKFGNDTLPGKRKSRSAQMLAMEKRDNDYIRSIKRKTGGRNITNDWIDDDSLSFKDFQKRMTNRERKRKYMREMQSNRYWM